DYQCPDCRNVEGELEALAARHGGVMSLAVRYFPLSPECNPNLTQNLHPNACWAARAAESAGVIGGAEGFWRMHRWLFSRGGSFTEAELREALPGLGFDAAAFTREMERPERNAAIAQDVDLGASLGLHFTPLVFVNGVEVRGWQTAGALTKAIDELAARGLPAGDGADDRPPAAAGKALEDWRAQPALALPRDAGRPLLGSGAPGARRVVIIGDLLEPSTQEADRLVRGLIASGASVRYEFRHFPLNTGCNPHAPRDFYGQSCLAAAAVEGAGLAGGAASQLAMHEWIINNQDRLSERALRDGAPAMAVDEVALMGAMNNPLVAQRIAEDVRLAKGLGIASVPMVFVDERWLPRLRMGPVNILERALAGPAAGGATRPGPGRP
ncbi:MAG: DsbA family protein, partial [Phycisphaerae bacterium]|nr:DsbA family protein [Phycisphaerae bacterium]